MEESETEVEATMMSEFWRVNREAIFVGIGVGISHLAFMSTIWFAKVYLPSILPVQVSEYFEVDLFYPIAFSLLLAFLCFLYLNSQKQNLLAASLALLSGPGAWILFNIFYYFEHIMRFPDYFLQAWVTGIIVIFCLYAAFFFSVSFLVGYFVRSKAPRVSKIDEQILNYIIGHDNRIKISECAEELGITETEVEEAISLLQKKGLIEMSSKTSQ